MGSRAQLFLVGKEQTALEKLRAQVEYQSANGSFGFLGSPATKTVNTFSDDLNGVSVEELL